MILANVWMIVKPHNRGVVSGPPASNATLAWVNVLADDVLGPDETVRSLFTQGYRARRVQIVLPERANANQK